MSNQCHIKVICSPTHDHCRFYRSVLYDINLIIILMFIICTCILRTHAISYKIGNLQTIAFVLNPNATVFYPKSKVQKLHTTKSLNPNARKFTPFHKNGHVALRIQPLMKQPLI